MSEKSQVHITIGLEIHSQINSNNQETMGQKLFSCSSNDSKSHIPNAHINYFDLGIPGTMPQLNLFCLQQAVKTGLALQGHIPSGGNATIEFDRKHYFYPDLPTGYQITQNFYPIVQGGHIILNSGKKIRIHHIHMEADAGQNAHKEQWSLVNLTEPWWD